jgi:hypothetical protein
MKLLVLQLPSFCCYFPHALRSTPLLTTLSVCSPHKFERENFRLAQNSINFSENVNKVICKELIGKDPSFEGYVSH